MEQIGDYTIHELASRLPMMTGDQYEIFKENIRTQGLMHPIIVLDKKTVVIDGRNRLKACIELNMEPRFIKLSDFLNESVNRRADTMQGGDLHGLVKAEQSGDLEDIIKEVIVMQNVHRRHLTDYEQFLTLKAVEGYPEHGGDRKSENQETDSVPCSLNVVSNRLGWSKTKVKQAEWLDKNASKDVKETLVKGELTVSGAYDEEKKKRERKPDRFGEDTGGEEAVFDANIKELVEDLEKVNSKSKSLYNLITTINTRLYLIGIDNIDNDYITKATIINFTRLFRSTKTMLEHFGIDLISKIEEAQLNCESEFSPEEKQQLNSIGATYGAIRVIAENAKRLKT